MDDDHRRSAASPALGWAGVWRTAKVMLGAGSVLAIIVALPYAFLWTLFWLSSDSWDFEGTKGLRHWLLVKGSRLDQLGLIAPTSSPPRYSVRFQEGTFPGWRVLAYNSSASPPAIVAAYSERCEAMGLMVTKREVSVANNDADSTEATLVCEIEPYIDAEFHAERKVLATISEVSVRVWGSE
jgi:hypothetical protein